MTSFEVNVDVKRANVRFGVGEHDVMKKQRAVGEGQPAVPQTSYAEASVSRVC